MKSANHNFYVTTTVPYINADPHIGFALELVQADVIARLKRLQGLEVFFSTGTDEFGQKIWEASQREGREIKEYVDYYAKKFLALKEVLNLSHNNFIRTTSPDHIQAVQELWRRCDAQGDIYKKKYKGLYCVGCEKFLTEKDMVDGFCLLHPSQKPEEVEEENYFFRLSKYKDKLLAYLTQERSIIPEWRREEAINFVKDAMVDFSVSRNKKRLSWGVPIPGDDTQVMYVWFGAFVNYLSTLGWPHYKEKFIKFWEKGEKVQIAGKDMVKFQSVMWQGMLMSAGLPTTDTIVYHGFITGEGGIRMSKSLGNVINPTEIVKEYGTDALRYFLLREISSFEDSPFTLERFKEAYNANLANGLGNLVSRVMKMAEDSLETPITKFDFNFQDDFVKNIENYNFQKACEFIWLEIGLNDLAIQKNQPFKLLKSEPEKAKEMIRALVSRLYGIAKHLEVLLPHSAEEIIKLIKTNKKPIKPLFPRKD